MQMRESRLSMQHLILQERKIQQEARHGTDLPQQLIPLTPSTSFSITGGAGNGAERALIFAIMKEMEEFQGKNTRLSSLLKTMYMGQKSWDDYINYYSGRVKTVDLPILKKSSIFYGQTRLSVKTKTHLLTMLLGMQMKCHSG